MESSAKSLVPLHSYHDKQPKPWNGFGQEANWPKFEYAEARQSPFKINLMGQQSLTHQAFVATIYGTDTMPTPEQYTDAKIEAADARADAKMAQLVGHIDVAVADLKGEIGKVGARLDGVERATAGTKTTVIATGIAAVAVVVGILAFGQQWFAAGLDIREIIRATVREGQLQQSPGQPQLPK